MALIPKSTKEQLQTLKDKNLVIDIDDSDVELFLEHNNYYRLRGYMTYFYTTDPVTSNEVFNGITTFSDIKNTYECDALLRRSLRDLLEVNELSLRTIYVLYFANYYSNAYFFYEDSPFKFNDLRESKIHKVRESIKRMISSYSHSPIIRRYTIGDTCRLPSWAFIEFMTFGDISIIYEATKDPLIKQLNNNHFNFPSNLSYNFLTSWIKSLNKLRNVCHHHERLFYKNFIVTPPKAYSDPFFKSIYEMNASNIGTLFTHIVISVCLCPNKEIVSHFIDSVEYLQLKFDSIDFQSAYGFPTNWNDILQSLSGYFIKNR